MTFKDGMDNEIVFYKNTNLDNMLKEVFIVYLEDGKIFDNTNFTPINIKMFSKKDYEEYDKEGCVYPNKVDNPVMFMFTAKNGSVYLGCFNGELKCNRVTNIFTYLSDAIYRLRKFVCRLVTH